MKSLLELLRDLVLLRRAPQDLPYSPALFAGALILSIVLDVAIERQFPLRPAGAAVTVLPLAVLFAAASLSALITVLLPYIALRLRKFDARFVQTGTALLGTGLALELLALPARLMIGTFPAEPEQITGMQAFGSLIAIIVLGWMVVVHAHILRHALDQRFPVGFLLAIAFLIIHVRILDAVFGGGAAA